MKDETTDDATDEVKGDMFDPDAAVAELIMDEWDRGRQYVSEMDDLYEDLYMMLRGERPVKNYDWQSNVVLNKVFQVVWTAIPFIVQKVFGADPIIGVISSDRKGAWQREQILQFWNTLQIDDDSPHVAFQLTFVMWVLRGLLNGVGIVKKSWYQTTKTTTEKQEMQVPIRTDEAGAVVESESVTYESKTTMPVHDWPVTEVINNKDIVVDWLLAPTQRIKQGRFVIHRSMQDYDSLRSSRVKYKNLDQINTDLNTTDSDTRRDHSNLTGMDGQETVPESDIYADIEIYERVGLLPVTDGEYDPGGDMKPMIVTVAKGGKDKKDVVIRFEKNPYGEINYIDMHMYLDAERWNSVGTVEPIKDTQTAINDNVNAMFDAINQNLMPPVIVNKFALWDWDTMQYAPHQRWLVGGPPGESIVFKEPSRITTDAWARHQMLDSELQLTSITNAMQGAGREKTATTNVMNAQLSAEKLDFLIRMIEITGLIPSAITDVRYAMKFAHPKTFEKILGEPFKYDETGKEVYFYRPAASAVKLDQQKDKEIQEDIQLIQILQGLQNPNAAKLVNLFISNILRNRNHPVEADSLLDEGFYEPKSQAGELQMLDRMTGAVSNQNDVPMTRAEQMTRRLSPLTQ